MTNFPSSPFIVFVNHLLADESWARQRLQKHAGKKIRIDLEVFSLQLKIASDGMLELASVSEDDAVCILLKCADLPLILQDRERAFSYVKVQGDADLANTVSFLSQHLRWEAEQDLSKLFGDVLAVRIMKDVKNIMHSVQQTHTALQENLAEYFQEELPMLVRPDEVAGFGSDVNKLRDDVERLLKRLEKLERL